MKRRVYKKKRVINKKGKICILGVIILFLGIGILSTNRIMAKDQSEENIEREEVLASTSISQILSDSSEEIDKGPSKSYGKVVYLTIDDGPSIYTDQILDILNENNAKATFFMINGNMNAYKDQVKNIANSENTAGFHSVTHDVKQLYKSNAAAKQEFDTCKETFKNITGKDSNVIRLPFGSKPYTPQGSYDEIVSAGYKLWDWTVDTEDWRSTSSQILSTVKTYAKSDHVVLLIHEKPQTVAVLDSILKYLKEQGYEFAAIGQNEEPRNYWNGKLNSDN